MTNDSLSSLDIGKWWVDVTETFVKRGCIGGGGRECGGGGRGDGSTLNRLKKGGEVWRGGGMI